IALHHLAKAAFVEDDEVCFDPTRTRRHCLAVAGALSARLPEGDARPWLLAAAEPFAFAAALLACWQRGLVPLIAPDTRPETIARLRPDIGGVIGDPNCIEGALAVPDGHDGTEPAPGEWRERESADTALV